MVRCNRNNDFSDYPRKCTMTRDDILSFLKTHKQEMQETYDIEHIHLFGSYARQIEGKDSDVNIVIEFEAENNNLRNCSFSNNTLMKISRNLSI